MRAEKISKAFAGRPVLRAVSLTLPESGILLLDGPSGVGKTTLLNILAGLIEPDSGRLTGFEGKRPAYAFQDDRLLPWMTALENVSLVCDKELAAQTLAMLGLADSSGKLPGQLSGGMRKRVNLARALCAPADYLLLDEPLQGLDRALRVNVLLPAVVKKAESVPVILVTHNVFEEEEEHYCRNKLSLA